MEELKPLGEIFEPDFRATCRGYTITVLHRLAAEYELSQAASIAYWQPGDTSKQVDLQRRMIETLERDRSRFEFE